MSISFGTPTAVLRTPAFSTRVALRPLISSGIMLAVALASAIAALQFGDYPLSIPEVMRALLVADDSFSRTVLLEWRLPIALSALLFGALLGVGGAIFQSLTRNPLGSPDVIGFDAGSYTGVVVTVLVLGVVGVQALATASLLGGLATAIVVYLLSHRRGVQGFHLIIVGIGVSAMLGSINAYLITRADISDAMTVGFWAAGSLSRITWTTLQPVAVMAAVVLLAAALMNRSLERLELGDDAATTLGTSPQRTRVILLVVGVATTALVTAAAGPIGFVALVAPQLARRLTHSAGAGLLGAACMGAALLSLAHLLSLVLKVGNASVPVGLITVCVGGCYLIYLLIREARTRAA
ncbi:FecCD family ABC transporter permease [Brachybacterium sp. DNPG3]